MENIAKSISEIATHAAEAVAEAAEAASVAAPKPAAPPAATAPATSAPKPVAPATNAPNAVPPAATAPAGTALATTATAATAPAAAAVGPPRLAYDTDIMTNYLPGATASAPQVVQSHTLNVQCFDSRNSALQNASLLMQSSTPVSVHINGTPVSLSATPIRYALDWNGELCIIVPSTGITTPTYTFSNLQDQNGVNLTLPITTIDPSAKALKNFETIKTGNDLKTTPGRSGKTLYDGKTPPSDADLDAAAQTFNDLAAASKTLPGTPPAVLSARMKPQSDRVVFVSN
jgi:hypothetical protein